MTVNTIRASVKISPKIKDTYYSIEFCEEWELTEEEQTCVEDKRKELFDTVYNEVAEQINDIANT